MTREELKKANDIVKKIERLESEIENIRTNNLQYVAVTNEDIRALVGSREQKLEELKKELEEI
jgi:hypothetical protein